MDCEGQLGPCVTYVTFGTGSYICCVNTADLELQHYERERGGEGASAAFKARHVL